MEMFEKEQVISGVAFFDGNIDGKQLNSGTLFILQELDSSKGTAKGQRTVEKKCDSAEIVKRIQHLEFPLRCKVTYEERVSKGSERMVVVDCVPIGSARMPDPVKKVA
ncbi:conserved protein of unknown function [Sterolibacterium denitrificans]|uniref:Uncharacterized protein n=1 Tax=Sterolibacterium denitrificans TaxID=157592 RepID=A0A7Z7MVM8_9PROT|nr:hypothetical protein [Sterolibacterium denitrificans]SMB28123.1 conserved protein of unknown function [Sterolibacterium denitrificans]